MPVVVPLHRAVGGLILIDPAGGHQHGSHHGKIPIGRGHHIGHDIPVVVFACPNISAIAADHTRYCVIDQRIEIFQSGCVKFFFILRIKNFCKNILKPVIVFLGYGVFRCKPQILFCIKCIVEAAAREAGDGLVCIMHTLHDAVSIKGMNQLAGFHALGVGADQLTFASCRDLHFCIFVNIPVCVTGDGDWFCPSGYVRIDSFSQNGSTENSAV